MNKLVLLAAAAGLSIGPVNAPGGAGQATKPSLARAIHVHQVSAAEDKLGHRYLYPGRQVKQAATGYRLSQESAYFVMAFVDGGSACGELALRVRVLAGASALGERGLVLSDGGGGGPVVVPIRPARGPTGNTALTVELLDAKGRIDQWSTTAVVVGSD